MKTKKEIRIARLIILARCQAFNHFLAKILTTIEFYDNIKPCIDSRSVLAELNNRIPYASYEDSVLINYEDIKKDDIEKLIEEIKKIHITTPYIIILLSDIKIMQAKAVELAYAGIDKFIITPIESTTLRNKLGALRRQN